MMETDEARSTDRGDTGSDALLRRGRQAWAALGILGVIAVIYLAAVTLSGLVVPLVVAAVMAALLVPAVDWMATRISRMVASGLMLLATLIVGGGAVVLSVVGITGQWDEITRQLGSGIEAALEWLASLGVDVGDASEVLAEVGDLSGSALAGIAGAVGGVFAGVGAFLAGTFVGLFLLFYLLADWSTLTGWLGSHLGLPTDLGARVIDDAVWSVRRYFYGVTLASLIIATLIGIAAAVLGVPLVFVIALLTFITSYIPYLGAFISGTFAAFIALGANGFETALILVVLFVAIQSILEPIITNQMAASELEIHPVVSFGSTIVGMTVAGVLGATLSAPVVAAVGQVRSDIRVHGTASASDADGTGS